MYLYEIQVKNSENIDVCKKIRNFYMQIQVNGKSKHNGMLFSGELMELGASTIRVIEK